MDGGRSGLSDLRERAREFAAREVAPHAARWERERSLPLATLRAAAAAGLTEVRLPGRSLVEACAVFEELAAADYAFAFTLVCHCNTARALAGAGLDVEPLLRGEAVGAFCLTEPGAGTDAAAITAAARPAAGGWRLDGVKAWVTNGAFAKAFLVYAQTDPAAGHRGIAGFAVQGPLPGLTAGEPYGLPAGHAMGISDVRFEDCPAAALVAPPGEGFKAAMRGIDAARAIVAAMCCGMLARGLELAVERVKARRAFGRPLADFQALQWALADAATELEAARLLADAAAAAIDAGGDASVAAAHAKKFAPAAALRHLAACIQLMGAEGLHDRHPLGRHLACAKMAQIQDGTNEVQNLVIARRLVPG
ncbi:MAG: acyl-CoA dehydrogenase family protein [Chloroflexota bacterium]